MVRQRKRRRSKDILEFFVDYGGEKSCFVVFF
jgi:hypothetical protein